MGFSHNNCGGFCVKAGQKHFKLLLEKMPERYKYHEGKEEELRQFLGKDVSILRKTVKGVKTYMTLRKFRESIEAEKTAELFKEPETFGCGCFSEDGNEDQ